MKMIELIEKSLNELYKIREQIVFSNIDEPELSEWKMKKADEAIKAVRDLAEIIKL